MAEVQLAEPIATAPPATPVHWSPHDARSSVPVAIQFRLPNGMRLMGDFRACDPVDRLYAFLSLHLPAGWAGNDTAEKGNESGAKFVLAVPMPFRRLDQPERTLEEEGLVPRAIVVVERAGITRP